MGAEVVNGLDGGWVWRGGIEVTQVVRTLCVTATDFEADLRPPETATATQIAG